MTTGFLVRTAVYTVSFMRMLIVPRASLCGCPMPACKRVQACCCVMDAVDIKKVPTPVLQNTDYSCTKPNVYGFSHRRS